MKSNVDKQTAVGHIMQVLVTPVIIIILGIGFSFITGYVANDYPFIVRVIVWIIVLILSWIITTCFLKLIFKNKISYFSYKYLFVAYIASVLFLWLVGYEDSEYSYVTSAITLITLVGAVSGIKLYKRRRDENDNKKTII